MQLAWDLVIVITAACVVGSGFFSGCETGLMSVSRARLRHYVRRGPDRRADLLADLLDRIEDPVLTCLIGTNFFNVAGSALLTVALTARLGTRGEWLAILIMSVVIVLFGEILPKVLFREFPERLTLAAVRWIRGSMVILGPVRWLMRVYSRAWGRLLPPAGEEAGPALDRQNVTALLLTHSRPASQERQFRQSLRRFLELANLDLRPIMRPFAQIVTVPPGASVGYCLETAARSGFSRLPVLAEDRSLITGWILVRDLLFLPEDAKGDAPVPAALLRSPLLVAATLSPYELFEELHAQGQQLAVVVDGQGATLGLITLEDLIETVVGSVQDEFDDPRLSLAGGWL